MSFVATDTLTKVGGAFSNQTALKPSLPTIGTNTGLSSMKKLKNQEFDSHGNIKRYKGHVVVRPGVTTNPAPKPAGYGSAIIPTSIVGYSSGVGSGGYGSAVVGKPKLQTTYKAKANPNKVRSVIANTLDIFTRSRSKRMIDATRKKYVSKKKNKVVQKSILKRSGVSFTDQRGRRKRGAGLFRAVDEIAELFTTAAGATVKTVKPTTVVGFVTKNGGTVTKVDKGVVTLKYEGKDLEVTVRPNGSWDEVTTVGGRKTRSFNSEGDEIIVTTVDDDGNTIVSNIKADVDYVFNPSGVPQQVRSDNFDVALPSNFKLGEDLADVPLTGVGKKTETEDFIPGANKPEPIEDAAQSQLNYELLDEVPLGNGLDPPATVTPSPSPAKIELGDAPVSDSPLFDKYVYPKTLVSKADEIPGTDAGAVDQIGNRLRIAIRKSKAAVADARRRLYQIQYGNRIGTDEVGDPIFSPPRVIGPNMTQDNRIVPANGNPLFAKRTDKGDLEFYDANASKVDAGEPNFNVDDPRMVKALEGGGRAGFRPTTKTIVGATGLIVLATTVTLAFVLTQEEADEINGGATGGTDDTGGGAVLPDDGEGEGGDDDANDADQLACFDQCCETYGGCEEGTGGTSGTSSEETPSYGFTNTDGEIIYSNTPTVCQVTETIFTFTDVDGKPTFTKEKQPIEVLIGETVYDYESYAIEKYLEEGLICTNGTLVEAPTFPEEDIDPETGKLEEGSSCSCKDEEEPPTRSRSRSKTRGRARSCSMDRTKGRSGSISSVGSRSAATPPRSRSRSRSKSRPKKRGSSVNSRSVSSSTRSRSKSKSRPNKMIRKRGSSVTSRSVASSRSRSRPKKRGSSVTSRASSTRSRSKSKSRPKKMIRKRGSSVTSRSVASSVRSRSKSRSKSRPKKRGSSVTSRSVASSVRSKRSEPPKQVVTTKKVAPKKRVKKDAAYHMMMAEKIASKRGMSMMPMQQMAPMAPMSMPMQQMPMARPPMIRSQPPPQFRSYY